MLPSISSFLSWPNWLQLRVGPSPVGLVAAFHPAFTCRTDIAGGKLLGSSVRLMRSWRKNCSTEWRDFSNSFLVFGDSFLSPATACQCVLVRHSLAHSWKEVYIWQRKVIGGLVKNRIDLWGVVLLTFRPRSGASNRVNIVTLGLSCGLYSKTDEDWSLSRCVLVR